MNAYSVLRMICNAEGVHKFIDFEKSPELSRWVCKIVDLACDCLQNSEQDGNDGGCLPMNDIQKAINNSREREQFVRGLIEVLGLEVRLFPSSLESDAYGASVPDAIWAMIWSSDEQRKSAYEKMQIGKTPKSE